MKLVGASLVFMELLFASSAGADGVAWSVVSGVKGDNGWYRSAVVVQVTAAGSGCPTPPFDITFNTTADNFSCGNGSTSLSLHFNIDPDPPVVTGATPDRAPDNNGWYTHPVNVTFAGSDSNSGIASCQTVTYGGPDSANATATGTCQDKAGNVSAPGSFQLKYDSTPPSVGGLRGVIGDGTVTLSWKQSLDTASVTVSRSPGRNGATGSTVYHGKGAGFRDIGLKMGVTYRYTVTAVDDAGNSAQAAAAIAMRALYAPAPGQHVKAGATLAWIPDKSASYYNVQLFRGRKKVLSTWPGNARFRLPRAWAFEHHRYTLKRGKYKWYVWPGLGPRSKAHYGKMLGGSIFTVR